MLSLISVGVGGEMMLNVVSKFNVEEVKLLGAPTQDPEGRELQPLHAMCVAELKGRQPLQKTHCSHQRSHTRTHTHAQHALTPTH